MNRRLLGLLAAFCLLSACNKTPEPVGKLEPLPRPAGTASADDKDPAAPPPAPPDASQVLLRWKLSAPTAYQLSLSGSTAAPAPEAPVRKARVRKSSRKKGAPEAPAEDAPSSAAQALTTFFLLRASTPTEGALPFALLPESPSGQTQQGTMSERGFVLGGISGPQRDLAVMVLELPAEPVRLGSTWTLTTDLVSLDILPPNFRQKDSRQQSEVKLTALTPAADGEQVATLEYELLESVSGQQGPPRPGRPGHAHGHENAPLSVKKAARGARSAKATKDVKPAPELSAEVRVSGRGEFLVKAGRWRSWEARMSTRASGLTLPGMPPGERVLRLTPLEPVPTALLQRLGRK